MLKRRYLANLPVSPNFCVFCQGFLATFIGNACIFSLRWFLAEVQYKCHIMK